MITKSNPDKQLTEHLKKEHKISPFSTYLKEIVYGGNDGIVTTFAVIAGFTGAQSQPTVIQYSFLTVLLFGMANLFADGIAMGLGNFLSTRAEKDVYNNQKNKERYEIRNATENEKKETRQILINKGFTREQAETLTSIYSENESYWLEFMMNHELQLPNPQGEKPALMGLATFIAFVFFGFIPLIPYFFKLSIHDAFFYSSINTLLALVLLGLLRFRISKVHLLRSIGEVVLVGGTSALIAYFVGTFFRI
jgi:VIT1/CCC1 family predicted Fe2+/Mn2+ transporter